MKQVLIAIILAMMFPSCSERMNEPVVMPDSTIVYPAKDSNDISARITFSRHYGQKSGRQTAISTVFPLMDDEDVYAVIKLENWLLNLDDDLMFHLDWIGPDGRSFYLKRVDLLAGDSANSLLSAVSISPDLRPAGKYKLRVYLFRELIAEKYFELKPASEIRKVSAGIIFYKSIDKETGELKGVDTVFEIRKKGILRVKVNLTNLDVYEDEELPFRLEWIGPGGESFYSKKSEVTRADSLSSISGSISITPDKREPGGYLLRVYLFDELVGEKEFVLKSSNDLPLRH